MYEGKAKKTRAGCDSARATTRRERGIGSPTRSNGITLVFGGASLIKTLRQERAAPDIGAALREGGR